MALVSDHIRLVLLELNLDILPCEFLLNSTLLKFLLLSIFTYIVVLITCIILLL